MKKKSLTILICTVALIATSTLFVSCGGEKVSPKGDSTTAVDKATEGNEEADKGKEQGSEKNQEDKNQVENKVVDFSKYTDNDFINFANEKTELFMGGYGAEGWTKDIKFYKTHVEEELGGEQSTIAKRTAFLEQIYAPGVFKEDYVTHDGRDYIINYPYENPMPYAYRSVKSKEVIDNDTIRVVFNVNFYHGYPVVNKNIKTIDFTEINGELRAKTVLFDKSIYNVIENPNEEREPLDNAEKVIFEYIYDELTPILRDDQRIGGIGERTYDPNTDSIYYMISIIEPTQSAYCYYLNMKNGSIYGHYEKRFVVAPKS